MSEWERISFTEREILSPLARPPRRSKASEGSFLRLHTCANTESHAGRQQLQRAVRPRLSIFRAQGGWSNVEPVH